MAIRAILIDANEGSMASVVHRFCADSGHPVYPSYSRYVGAASKPWSEFVASPGEFIGPHWLTKRIGGRQIVRGDVNFWKTFICDRVSLSGVSGAVTLHAGTPAAHELYIDHLGAEYGIQTTGRGRSVWEWRMRPGCRENHWWDCLVGAALAAASLGLNPLAIRKDKVGAMRPKRARRNADMGV
jgi:hypothetical protein